MVVKLSNSAGGAGSDSDTIPDADWVGIAKVRQTPVAIVTRCHITLYCRVL